MKHLMHFGLISALLFAAAETSNAAGGENTPTETTKKSIVPSKYSGKYKGAGDAVSDFIKAQTEGQFASFAALARKNGIDEAQVAKYEGLVADKANNHGIEGRARMTLGNMLRAKARKDGKLVSLAGDETAFEGLAKPAVSGAAAKAQETAATASEANTDSASETSTADTSGDATTE